jgi:hypothetical protein
MRNKRGQAMVELVLLLPLMLALAGGVCAVVYMCWQGIKVQQAANLAARIQGQERVAGGVDLPTIKANNGVRQGGGDEDPLLPTNPTLAQNQIDTWKQRTSLRMPPLNSVYGKIWNAVHKMFGQDEQNLLFVPAPTYGLVGYSDKVKVVRFWDPPSVFGLKLPIVTLEATAYGGEDPHMFGLVRWGSTSNNVNQQFWSEPDPNANPNAPQTQYHNLKNPYHD